MNNTDKTFSFAGFEAADISAYALIASNTEQCFSFAVGQNALERCFTTHGTWLAGHSFMLTVDLSMDTMYHWDMAAVRHFQDAVFTVVGAFRQPGAKSQRQSKRVAAKRQVFVRPVVCRTVNLRL